MGMPPGFGTSLQGTKGAAVVVTDTAFMGITAVGDAAVGVPSGKIAARHLADGDCGGAGGTDGLAVATAAVAAMGGDGQRQQRQGQNAEKDLFELHKR